uniref:Guanylate-binding protein/Atlastin C-terminal domain-containing protein n=1 Tax=Castor canadensis TaxID=51338 RepID=A0A8C0ZPJ9_CASCN
MVQQVSLPTDTLQEPLDVHTACKREAIAVFMELSFKDDNQELQERLVVINFKAPSLKNEEASLKYCQAELKKISEPLIESHSLYLEVKMKVEQAYQLLPRTGVKANEVFQTFLQSQAATEKSILQSVKALTEGEKTIAAEKKAVKKELELLRQKQKEQEEAMKTQERSFQEHIAQQKKKWEVERENLLRESEKMLQHKLKVQEELLVDRFKRKYEVLTEEISRLNVRIKENENNQPLKTTRLIYVVCTVLFVALLKLVH